MEEAKTEKQKVKEIADKLEEGLKELFESEKYKSYLSTMSKFHTLILSILVDTFFTRIFMPGQHLEIHNISVV